jgi:hypothetical protein
VLQESLVSDVIFYGVSLPCSDQRSLAKHLSLNDAGYELLLTTCGFAVMLSKTKKLRHKYDAWNRFITTSLPSANFPPLAERKFGTIQKCKFLQIGSFDKTK